ncbi:hypothetical protein BCR32DRAFT_265974 [Anaeromyces robustus]|uniref:Uncharacterized protein n=1 Tax=Anaeromyces robustus TaxID=1754192 RepID=A0A1Y1XGR7_9FUNG|nr:hypothetical protein BCR32DRAFT_265974 [Anaeromyces robustus]|eukprot:ORX84935.1 hypothetical protein BCR32DRAFT_265974 [Anaeromyces robustus]
MAGSKIKIRFPNVGKCICCCCLSEDTSMQVCSIIMALYLLYGAWASRNDFFSLVTYGATFVSNVFFTIGLFQSKLNYMIQYIYIYLVYLIIMIVSTVFALLVAFGIMGSTYSSKAYNSMETEEKAVVGFSIGIVVVMVVIPLFIEIYYYLVCGSYVQGIEKTLEDEDFNRDLEDGKY